MTDGRADDLREGVCEPDCGNQGGSPGEGDFCVESQLMIWILLHITLVGIYPRHLRHIGNIITEYIMERS